MPSSDMKTLFVDLDKLRYRGVQAVPEMKTVQRLERAVLVAGEFRGDLVIIVAEILERSG